MLLWVCSVIDHRRPQNVRTSVTHLPNGSCATFLFLPHCEVICDLLLNRCTTTWNLFVKEVAFVFRLLFKVRIMWLFLGSLRNGNSNNNATKQWYHCLKIINNPAAHAARILANIFEDLCITMAWNHQIWGFNDNMHTTKNPSFSIFTMKSLVPIIHFLDTWLTMYDMNKME